MAAPTFQANGAGQTSTGAALSVPWPTHQADDLGVLVVESTGTSTPMTAPTGWTAVAGTPLVDVASVAGSTFYVFWKRATSSAEPNVVTGAQTDHQLAMLYTYRGVANSGNPIDVSATATKAVASTTATMPTITTTSATTLVLLVASRPNDSAATNHFGTITNAALASLAEEAEWGSTDGDGGGFVVSHGTKAAAGVVGTTTISKGSSTTDCTLSIALLPMPTPPSAPTYRASIQQRHRPILRFNKRRGPVTPPAQVVVAIASWVPPAIQQRHRFLPRPNLRRSPVTPLTQTTTVVVSWVPAVTYRRRPARPLLRRRQQPTAPLVVAVWVPAVETPRRPRPFLRRRTQPLVPLTQIVVVPDAVYQPPIVTAHRARGFLRRRTMPTVPLTQTVPDVVVTYVPAIEAPRRARAFTRRRNQPAVTPQAVVYIPAIESPRHLRLFGRRRQQPGVPSLAITFTPPTAARPPHRILRPRRGTTTSAATLTVTVTRPSQIRRARRFGWLRRRPVQQPTTPSSILVAVVDVAGRGVLSIVRADVASSLVFVGQHLAIAVTAPVADVGPSCHLELVTAGKTTTLTGASMHIVLVAAATASTPVASGAGLAAIEPGTDSTVTGAGQSLNLDAATGTSEIE